MFYTSVDLCFNTGILNMFADFVYNILYIFFTDAFPDRYFVYQIVINFRLQIF